MKNLSFIIFLLLCVGQGAWAQNQVIQWQEVESGIWRGVVGQPEAYDLLKAAGATPNKAALAKLGPAEFPMPQNQIVAYLQDGKTYLRFPLVPQEQLYGFGLNFQTVHQRGKILELHVDHYGGKDNGRTHAPTPFYVSSNGYGVFVNSARYLKVWAGTGVRQASESFPTPKNRNDDKSWSARPYSDAVEIMVPAGGVEFYVFAGPRPLAAVKRYNLFNGGGPLPPRWGLGFTQRVRTQYTALEVEKEVEEFAQRGYPLDFVGLEPGWQSTAYPGSFTWDKNRFPDPAGFTQKMLQKGIRLNLWINPYVSPTAPFYQEIKPYTASHTVWLGLVPDFTMPAARRIFFNQLQKDQVAIGVSGYKIDEVDGYDYWLWPDIALFPSGTSAEQMRQTYGLLTMRYSAEMFRQRNQRTFGLVRASNGGGTSFPYVLYNDYYNHEDFITALLNSGFAGVLWTPEVRASKTGEEWLRRFQSNVFSPMAMINAWASGTKPWTYPEVEKQVKEYALLRMRMMPYWYTEFAKYHFEGTPPFRAMNLEENYQPEVKKDNLAATTNQNLEENPYLEAINKEVKDQYMAGEYLLVAPMFAGQTSRKVILPPGRWYDFYTGAYVGNGQVLTITPGLDKIPVYVKDGGIIPLMPPLLQAPKAGQRVPLEIRHYGENNGTYCLYDDDGETFDYEKGEYTWRDITVKRQKNGRLKGNLAKAPAGKINSYGPVTFKFMTTK